MYNASKQGLRDVTVVSVPQEKVGDFTLRGMGQAVIHALGFSKSEEKPLESVKVSRKKQRGRLLEHVDLDNLTEAPKEIGSMQDIDSALVAAKEKTL
jgi:hypothetical protein